MNHCTLILSDGTEITIDGDYYHVNFSELSSTEMICFAKRYLAEHPIFVKEEKRNE